MLTQAPDNWYVEVRDGIARDARKEKVFFVLAIASPQGLTLAPVVLTDGQFAVCMGAKILTE
jgi:hypothetical protein